MDLRYLNDVAPWDWPENAGEALLSVLDDHAAEVSDRRLAAELAGNLTVVDEELATALLSILRNGQEPDSLRATAARALGPALEHMEVFGFEDPDDILLSEARFHEIQQALRQLYSEQSVSKELRRRSLEAAVHAPQDWHEGAIRAAYASDDGEWRLTAVYGMRFVGGFDQQILEALGSDNPDMRFEAVCAAGNWGIDAAWSQVAALVTAEQTDKSLLLAAIDAVAGIRPQEAAELLGALACSEDEDVADGACEALAVAAEPWGDEEDALLR